MIVARIFFGLFVCGGGGGGGERGVRSFVCLFVCFCSVLLFVFACSVSCLFGFLLVCVFLCLFCHALCLNLSGCLSLYTLIFLSIDIQVNSVMLFISY